MDVGIQLFFNNFEDGRTDRDVWKEDVEVASWAEPMGLDFISGVEHHFHSYAVSPDNVSFLSYMAAKTKRIKLMTGAVILPWNDPVRVTERMIQLDHLSGGRVLFGMGRGLARREYERFGVDMNESRGRFDEAAKMITRALETGILESDGPYYRRAPLEIRPKPFASFKGRTACVAMSSDSVPICAELGAAMMCFASKPWDQMASQVDTYNSLYDKYHKTARPKPIFTNFMFCDESQDRAAEMAHTYMGNYYDDLMVHYEIAGTHWKAIKGYGDYASGSEELAKLNSYEAGKAAYVQVNDFGTPNRILEEYERRRKLLGEFDMLLCVAYGGMKLGDIEKSMRLYTQKVLPELKSWH